MFKIFSKNNTIDKERERWFFALEKMVNIALIKTERGDNDTVKQILKELEKIFRGFCRLKKESPEKFNSLLWSKDFFDRYVVPINKNESAEIDGETKSIDELKEEAAVVLNFTPERELKGLTQFLDSYEKIWRSASQNNNTKISRYVVYQLNGMLAELVEESDNHLFVEQFLRLFSLIAHTAIKNLKRTGETDPSLYSAAINWYIDIVFSRLRKSNGFDLSYLELFDKYFFSSIKQIISRDQSLVFHSLVSYLVDGINIPSYYQGKIWDYGHLILRQDQEKYRRINNDHDIENKLVTLATLGGNINTQRKLDEWLMKFDELKVIIEPNLTDAKQNKAAEEIERKIMSFVITQFKYQNLLEVVFAVGAYCLFKGRYDYIKYLWEYNQPPDADASWVGPDIVPHNLNIIISFYFKEGLFEKKYDFWEGHHGSGRYFKIYLLLLLLRSLRSLTLTKEGVCEQIQSYKLPDLDVYLLSDLQHSIDGFIVLARELKQKVDMLVGVGFKSENLDELFDDKLVPFLIKLKDEAQKKISAKHKSGNISQKRVEDFKEGVLRSFYNSVGLRDMFDKYCMAYEDKTKDTIMAKQDRFGLGIVDDKAAFFDNWHIGFVGWEENYGRNIGSGEDVYLFDSIARECDEITENDFKSSLSKIKDKDDLFMITTNVALWQFFEASQSFKPKWYKDIKQLEVKGFKGWYDFNGHFIPVFEIYHSKIDKQILILNKKKIGKLVQLSPLNEGEKQEKLKDIFYMDVRAFSENKKLMDDFIKKPPEWLQKIGDEKKQREHLEERVLVRIFERFRYDKPEDFKGYKLLLKEG